MAPRYIVRNIDFLFRFGGCQLEGGIIPAKNSAAAVKTGFLCVYLAVLELTLYTRLASNSENLLPLSPKYWD